MLIAQVSAQATRMRLVGAIERAGHDWIGQDVGVAMGGAAAGVTVTDDPLEAIAPAQSGDRFHRARRRRSSLPRSPRRPVRCM